MAGFLHIEVFQATGALLFLPLTTEKIMYTRINTNFITPPDARLDSVKMTCI